MPRKLPPHVERNHVKGNTYLSFRIGKGPRIRLPCDPSSAEFREAYASTMAGETPSTRTVLQRDAPGTIGALIASYMQTGAFIALRTTSKGWLHDAARNDEGRSRPPQHQRVDA
jgi:enterobacteria phage integrase